MNSMLHISQINHFLTSEPKNSDPSQILFLLCAPHPVLKEQCKQPEQDGRLSTGISCLPSHYPTKMTKNNITMAALKTTVDQKF